MLSEAKEREYREQFTPEFNTLAWVNSRALEFVAYQGDPLKGKNGQILKRNRKLYALMQEVYKESGELLDLARTEKRVKKDGSE